MLYQPMIAISDLGIIESSPGNKVKLSVMIQSLSQILILLFDIVTYKVALHSAVTFFANGFLWVAGSPRCKFDNATGHGRVTGCM